MQSTSLEEAESIIINKIIEKEKSHLEIFRGHLFSAFGHPDDKNYEQLTYLVENGDVIRKNYHEYVARLYNVTNFSMEITKMGTLYHFGKKSDQIKPITIKQLYDV